LLEVIVFKNERYLKCEGGGVFRKEVGLILLRISGNKDGNLLKT